MNDVKKARFGAIEAGGTKFVCAVADNDERILAQVKIPTTTPKETMAAVVAFFTENPVDAMAIGSFGPIDVNERSKTYGYITNTPKPGWANYDFLGELKAHFDIPYVWNTDVNVAAYGELKRGAAVGKKSCVYFTVGTGVGAGAVVDGKLLTGYGHPEMGHMLMRRAAGDDFAGICPFHHDCLEGLCCGPAIATRVGRPAYELAKDDKAWEYEAYYLAQACVDLTCVLAPEMIIFGGGVSKQSQLFDLMRQSFSDQLNGYLPTPALDEYLVPVKLGDNAGITGCFLLAKEAFLAHQK